MKLLESVLIISSAAVSGWLTAGLNLAFHLSPSFPKKIPGFSIVAMGPVMLRKLAGKPSTINTIPLIEKLVVVNKTRLSILNT